MGALPAWANPGDSAVIHHAAVAFRNMWVRNGILEALFGEYDRHINNPGVGALYGLMYGAFGAPL